MPGPRSSVLAACLWIALAPARAEEAAPLKLDDVVYKGIVGKALDVVPMDPEHRAALQRTNAVVSNTALGRTLTALAGLTNPVLMVGGFVWGVFAASNIKPASAPAIVALDKPSPAPPAVAAASAPPLVGVQRISALPPRDPSLEMPPPMITD